MNELISKELLHEPMKDLAKQYPQWLQENKHKIEEAEYERFSAQYKIVLKIITIFEKSDSELKPDESKIVTELMQEMQSHGNPPESLMKVMNPSNPNITDEDSEQLPPECKNM